VLASDRSKLAQGWDEVAYVTATVVDGKGVPVPGAGTKIAFEVSGPGAIVAVDNADNSSTEPFQATARKTFDGQCLAILKATSGKGTMTVKATAEGLETGSIQIQAGGNH
jgi:beta-galactosidase